MEPNEVLFTCIEKKDWDTLVTILKPKDFCMDLPRSVNDFSKMCKVSETLLDGYLPERVMIVLLKCLGNSCVAGYLEREVELDDAEIASVNDNIYKLLFRKIVECPDYLKNKNFPFQNYFPYEGIIKWVVKTIKEFTADNRRLVDEQSEILRLCLQFLCNFFTYSFNIETNLNANTIMEPIKDENFNNTITNLVASDKAPIARAACAYVHNMVKRLKKEFYSVINKKELTSQLIKSIVFDIHAALDTVVLLLQEPCYLKEIYEEVSIDNKLYLLDIVHQEVSSSKNKQGSTYKLPMEAVEFLSNKFKAKSDLILKTVESPVNTLDPTEVTILLDILGVMTTNPELEVFKKLQEDKSLLINCIHLLKAIQMAGKASNNCFTPIQKLGDLALNSNNGQNENSNGDNSENHNGNKEEINAHPAFGFKAALIRVIGNLVYRNEQNQNLVRENEAIALLLDCCNIDARNPLITQWTTLAIKNLLDNNKENQEFIRKTVKVGVVDNATLKEFGVTLHDEGEGNAIGIMPLPKAT